MLLEKEEFKTPQVRRRGHLTVEERKQLNYLKRKEKVAPLDKAERYELIELEHKAGLYEARENKKCVICGEDIQGYGNNAAPVADGICCDKCNASKVIPARLSKINKKEESLTEEQDEYKVTVYDVAIGSRGPIGRKRKVYVKSFPNKEEAYKVAKLELDKVSHTGLGYSYAEIELPDGDVDVLSESLTEGKNLDDIVYDALSRITLKGNDGKPRHPEVYANPKGNGYRLEIEDDESGIDQVASIAKKYKLNYSIKHIRDYTEITVDLPERKFFDEDLNLFNKESLDDKIEAEKLKYQKYIKAMENGARLTTQRGSNFISKSEDSNGLIISDKAAEYLLANLNLKEIRSNSALGTCDYVLDKDLSETYKVVDKEQIFTFNVHYKNGKVKKKTIKATDYHDAIKKIVKDKEVDSIDDYFVEESFEDEHLGVKEQMIATDEDFISDELNKSDIKHSNFDGEFKFNSFDDMKAAEEIICQAVGDNYSVDKNNLTILIESIEETPEPGPEAGIASLVNKLIIDEWEAIQGYNDAIVAAETEGYSDIANVLRDIANEENLHVGQLEQCMQQLSPNTESINQGEVEAEGQLNTEISEDPEEGMHY